MTLDGTIRMVEARYTAAQWRKGKIGSREALATLAAGLLEDLCTEVDKLKEGLRFFEWYEQPYEREAMDGHGNVGWETLYSDPFCRACAGPKEEGHAKGCWLKDLLS